MEDRINNTAPHFLTSNQLPLLARCIVAVVRGVGTAKPTDFGTVSCVVLLGSNTDRITIRAEEWRKLAPYLKDGSLDYVITPALPLVSAGYAAEDPFYERVLIILGRLYSNPFPTSKL